MDGLEGIIGSIGSQDAEDFIRRFERGSPWDEIDDRETLQHYGRVVEALSPEEYRRSAVEAFSRFSAQERRRFGALLARQARRQDFGVPDMDGDGRDHRLEDPGMLADVTARLHGVGPGVLRDLLGAGGGGLSHPLAKAALGGIAAMAMKRGMARRR